MEKAVNENLCILMEKLFQSEELAEKFSKCKTLDEFYNFCSSVQKGYTKQELQEAIDTIGDGGWEYIEEETNNLSDKNMDMVAGGVNLSGKMLAGILGVLSLVSPISSNYASAYDKNQGGAVSVGKSVSVNSKGWRRFITSSTLKRLAVATGVILVVGTAIYFARRALKPNMGIANVGSGKGLANMGNSCYINAALQQLYSISEFRLKVMDYKPSGDKDLTDEKIEALQTIFKSLDEEKPLERDVLYNAVHTLGHKGKQDDSHHFMTSFKYIGDVLERLGFSADIPSINPKVHHSVQDFFNSQDAYDYGDSMFNKDQIIVGFTERVCDTKGVKKPIFEVSQEIDIFGNKKHLTGVIIKTGSKDSGHYYSYKKMSGGQWYEFNDSSVTAVEYQYIEKDIRENARVLIYSS